MTKPIASFEDAFVAAAPRPADNASRSDKKNYAERLSRHLSTAFANALRPSFPGIKPDVDGTGQESYARTSKGVKKLDVNYSTPELGLGLGVSIKTLNYRDGASGRYTKNFSRIDNELRAEALDYHKRQPYAVMVAVIFLPEDSASDGSTKSPSSFGKAVQVFRHRALRDGPEQDGELFERIYLGLYDEAPRCTFFDTSQAPPRLGLPSNLLSFEDCVAAITRTYDTRNNPPFEWA